MKTRCLNPNSKRHKDYGGRGITVCDRWLKFENFLADMGECPKNKQLDRINNDGPYSPENCRWATQDEQHENRRVTLFLTYEGVTKPLFVWAKEKNLNYRTLIGRYNKGWSPERILC
jgi:hypothetical protein